MFREQDILRQGNYLDESFTPIEVVRSVEVYMYLSSSDLGYSLSTIFRTWRFGNDIRIGLCNIYIDSQNESMPIDGQKTLRRKTKPKWVEGF